MFDAINEFAEKERAARFEQYRHDLLSNVGQKTKEFILNHANLNGDLNYEQFMELVHVANLD